VTGPFFLGIDQSLNHTGLVILDVQGNAVDKRLIEPKKLRGVERLAFIRDAIVSTGLPGGIKRAALEGYAYGAGVGRYFDLGEVGGLVRLLLHDAKVPFSVVSPTSLKKFVTGDSTAGKADMIKAVNKRWNAGVDDDNVADAYGLARVALAMEQGTTIRAELEVITALQAPPVPPVAASRPSSRRRVVSL
jgi:Holliday junction resolvasome RuvABC endonuclease subunit